MNSSLWAIFISVFIAELGDKTQLATMMFASQDPLNKWYVFIASSAALTCSSFIAVILGSQISQWLEPKYLQLVAGLGFIGIGIWTLWGLTSSGA